jgi:hypothetical protein
VELRGENRLLASQQHPDDAVLAGELRGAAVYGLGVVDATPLDTPSATVGNQADVSSHQRAPCGPDDGRLACTGQRLEESAVGGTGVGCSRCGPSTDPWSTSTKGGFRQRVRRRCGGQTTWFHSAVCESWRPTPDRG